MKRVHPTTPIWVKLSVGAALALALGWWSLDWRDRHGNEQRLSGIASQIAGRQVEVRCPARSAA